MGMKGFMEGKNYIGQCIGTLGELFQDPLFTRKNTEISIISALANIATRATFTPGGQLQFTVVRKNQR